MPWYVAWVAHVGIKTGVLVLMFWDAGINPEVSMWVFTWRHDATIPRSGG